MYVCARNSTIHIKHYALLNAVFRLGFSLGCHLAAAAELTVSAMQAAQSTVPCMPCRPLFQVSEIEDNPHLCVLSVPAKQEITEIVNLEIALSDNMEGTKTVTVIPQKSPSLLIVDRRCLFAFDQMRIGNTSLPLLSPQTPGKQCPCCGKIAEKNSSKQKEKD